jgi:hypothetical protein
VYGNSIYGETKVSWYGLNTNIQVRLHSLRNGYSAQNHYCSIVNLVYIDSLIMRLLVSALICLIPVVLSSPFGGLYYLKSLDDPY